jgi:hypothetical protein
MTVVSAVTKDWWVANMVEPWNGEGNSTSIIEFFTFIDIAAEMGKLGAKDKVRLAKMKIKGPARVFWTSKSEMMSDDVTYERFKELMIERFKDKRSAQFHYVRMQMASQGKHESPEMCLDRLRKMWQQHTGY